MLPVFFYCMLLILLLFFTEEREKKNKVVSCRERETSCHKRLNWARLARQISQPTVCFPSVTFLCSFSQGTRQSSSPPVLYSWAFAGFLGFRNFIFIAHFSSLFMSCIELSYFKLQWPAAYRTVLW